MSFSRNLPGLFSTHTTGRFQSQRYPVGIRIFVPRAIRSLQDDTLRGLGTQGLRHSGTNTHTTNSQFITINTKIYLKTGMMMCKFLVCIDKY